MKELGAYKAGSYILTSGIEEDYYIDCWPAMIDAECLNLIRNGMEEIIIKHFSETNAVGGLEISAIPIATSIILSDKIDIKSFCVRKNIKNYGTMNKIEGYVLNKRVVIVDDVISLGGSVLEATKAVEDAGGIVLGYITIVDRLMDKYPELNRYEHHTLLTVEDFSAE